MNAFELISRSQGFNLGNLFEKQLVHSYGLIICRVIIGTLSVLGFVVNADYPFKKLIITVGTAMSTYCEFRNAADESSKQIN